MQFNHVSSRLKKMMKTSNLKKKRAKIKKKMVAIESIENSSIFKMDKTKPQTLHSSMITPFPAPRLLSNSHLIIFWWLRMLRSWVRRKARRSWTQMKMKHRFRRRVMRILKIRSSSNAKMRKRKKREHCNQMAILPNLRHCPPSPLLNSRLQTCQKAQIRDQRKVQIKNLKDWQKLLKSVISHSSRKTVNFWKNVMTSGNNRNSQVLIKKVANLHTILRC